MLHVAASTTTEHLPVNDEYHYFLDKFPTVFSGENGVLKDYQLELGIDSNGRWCRIRVLHPYITVPGWKQGVKQLEDQDNIQPVTGPTLWSVSPVVIVGKQMETYASV